MESLSFDILQANLKRRSELLRTVREFFYAGDFVETTTETRIPAPAPEEYIESLPCAGEFLRTSPELAMKELICGGMERIFQIGPAFRAGERGRKHREEFTIMEYYATGMDYRELARFTAKMLENAACKLSGSTLISYREQQIDFSKHSFITVLAKGFIHPNAY